jgi:hypothetical protein
MEEKMKHLEFIQNVITRMNQNSFLIKGWAVTLVSALYALAAKDADMRLVLISYIAIATFWALDAYYLSTERQYRGLYDSVRNSQSSVDYNMDASSYLTNKTSWASTFISKTILTFYGLLTGIALIVMFLFQ